MARYGINNLKDGIRITSIFMAFLVIIIKLALRKKNLRVCVHDFNLFPIDDGERKAVREMVLRQFPWAERSKFIPPSRVQVVLDRRNEAVSQQGYFTIGFDNFDVNTSVPSGYDFYVKYSSDHLGSHFYLKPNAIRLGIHGCKRNVKFIYRDNDIVLQPWVKDGFITNRITFQQEFHNLSSNAGLIMSVSSAKTRQMMRLWDAGAGLAENIEQDQTVFRALFQEHDKQFFSAVPNIYAVHIYSGVLNRERALATLRLKHSVSFQRLKYLWMSCLVFCSVQHLNFVLRNNAGSQKDRKELSLVSRVLLRIGAGNFFMTVAVLEVVRLLANNPLQIGSSLGIPVRSRAKSFRMGYQLVADHRARVWREADALLIGNNKVAFKVLHTGFFSPFIVGELLDILHMLLEMLPIQLSLVLLILSKAISIFVRSLYLLDIDVLYLFLLDNYGRRLEERRKGSIQVRV